MALVLLDAPLHGLALLAIHRRQPFLELGELRLVPVAQVGEQLLVVHGLHRGEQHGVAAQQEKGKVELLPYAGVHGGPRSRIQAECALQGGSAPQRSCCSWRSSSSRTWGCSAISQL